MKSKSPFAIKSPLLAYKSDMKGNYANPEYVPETIVGAEIGANIAKTAASVFESYAASKKGESGDDGSKKEFDFKGKPFGDMSVSAGPYEHQFKSSNTKSETSSNIKGETFTDQHAWDSNRNDVQSDSRFQGEGGMDRFFTAAGVYRNKEGTGINTTYDKGKTRFEDGKRTLAINMNGSPNKLIGDTMDPYGQINPGAVPPNQAQNDLGAQPIIGAQGSQPSARAIDMAAIGNPYATPGADFDPQSKMKAESIFGSPMQRQGLMNLGTPLHHDSEKQAHTHPSKTTTKMKPDGEYPGARYVKGDLVDQDDLLDKTELDAHTATQVQSDKKGSFIKEMPDSGPGSDIETDRGFGKKIRLENMGRSSYTSNMKDQMDPHNFLFKNTPKK